MSRKCNAQSKSPSALAISLWFMLASWIAIPTMVIPMFAIAFPGAAFERLSAGLIGNVPYGRVQRLATVLMAVLLVVVIVLQCWNVYHRSKRSLQIHTGQIVFVMLLCFPLIHTFGFYLDWGLSRNYDGDGQMLLDLGHTMFASSFLYIPAALLIDWARVAGRRAATSRDKD